MWYAAYGSNLDRRRMLCYVQGGCPAGATRTYAGCLDPAPPVADRAVTLPFALYFGGASSVWGGGVAVLRRTRDDDAGTLARAWLLTEAQFADVVRQENGRSPTGELFDLTGLPATGALTLGTGWYDHLLLCGTIDGLPVITVTSPTDLPERRPSAAYVDYIVNGLVDTHGLSRTDARAYVERRVGSAASV